MKDELIILSLLEHNRELIMDRIVLSFCLFLLLVLSSMVRNILFEDDMTKKEIFASATFISILLVFLTPTLKGLLRGWYYPSVMALGLSQKEFIRKLASSRLVKILVTLVMNGPKVMSKIVDDERKDESTSQSGTELIEDINEESDNNDEVV